MISDLSSFSALRDRMRFLQVRQRVLAQNVAQADTPGYRPKDVRMPEPSGSSQQVGGFSGDLARTDPRHIALSGGAIEGEVRAVSYETRPSGNAINLEEEMLKVSQNQIEFQAAANLYQKSLSTLKLALGRKS